MTSVVAQDSVELRLTLPVERASTSPFPSPGSPFYPPPRLGAHEFALPLRSRTPTTACERDDKPLEAMPRTDGATTPTAQPQTPSLSVTTTMSPTTPTPDSVFTVRTPTTQITVPDPPPHSDAPVSLNAAAAALTSSSRDRDSLTTSIRDRDSLTSSRPAPPSPALSRRTSVALSRHSSYARSRRQSKASSVFQPASHEPEPSTSSTTTVTPASQPPAKHKSLLFKIRDFAYAASDDRHTGNGPDAPRTNRPRRRWSTYSAASVSSAGSSRADDEDGADGDEWGSYRWNTLSTRFSWGPGQGPQEGGPSRTDFDRNFEQTGDDEEGDGEEEEYVDAPQDGEDEYLVPGLYRALYAFEPEGTAEMALEEEQVVRVVGRGGGVGWAVVEKEGGGHALVPESYLELVEAD
ncbi:hypothetical protein C8Q80DRAFT_1218440 [Daedaleopsis nitida]|nr:hypothetical protein C8Q80DRAFT_1218440 [Daedaleopsis nitida]